MGGRQGELGSGGQANSVAYTVNGGCPCDVLPDAQCCSVRFVPLLPPLTQGAPAEPNRVDKKKMWEALQPLLKTDGAKVRGGGTGGVWGCENLHVEQNSCNGPSR